MGCPSRGWHAATRSTGSSEADIAHAACRWAQPAYLLVQKRLLERHVPPCRVAVDAAQVVSAAAGMKFWLQTGPHTPSGTWRTMSPTIWLAELPQVCAGGRQSAAAAKLRIEPTRRTIKRYKFFCRQRLKRLFLNLSSKHFLGIPSNSYRGCWRINPKATVAHFT